MEWWDALQQGVFEQLIMPLMLAVGLDAQIEEGYVGALWLMLGVVQLSIVAFVLVPLERWWPAEAVAPQDRAAVWAAIRPDVIYTALHRLGLFRAVLFVSLEPLWSSGLGLLRTWGLPSWHLDALWPDVTDVAWVSFLIYLVVFDFLGWLMHWLQHRWAWWWQLHALHHSQRHMTAWTDNRNHLLDDVIHDGVFVFVGLIVGVAPAQFVALVVVMQLLENLSHANLRWSFGRWGDRLLVSPRFHRRHHAIEPMEVFHGQRAAAVRGVNYGVLFPWWDQLFGTADHQPGFAATGLRDQLPEHGGRDYGQGFWAQQWLGLMRLWGRA
ncbi:MAG: sterol desaturase family protein [Betaproteobacteria bacterium]|jgi:sterol desaturase/sphingolipid hydroxylase (fatty acid hydroxylase superfamily)